MERSIKEAAQQCVDLFTQCLEVPPLMENEWAENRLADMNLWISGTGACAQERASLDSRLASRPEAHDVVVNSLRLLGTVIEECLIQSQTQGLSHSYPDEENSAFPEHESQGRSFSPWSDDSSSDGHSTDWHEVRNSSRNPLYEAMYNIESMLDQLSRIAVAIRRSGRRSRLQRADQLFKATEHQELEGYLVRMLLLQLKSGPHERDPSKLNEVQLRLVHCNLKRQNRFLYSQRHAMGLEAGYVRRTRVSKPAESAQEITEGKPSSEFPDDSRTYANKSRITGTSASRLSDGFHLSQLGHAVSQRDHAISVTPSAVSTTALELDYPRPPQLKDDARLFRCPCCCEALPVTMTEKIRWRKHIEDDLSPYTCVLTNCDQPYVLFNTKDSWRQHMLKDHSSMSYWTCFACGDGSQFFNREAFVQHTESFHAATIPPAHIAVLVELSKKTMPSEIRHCPLCNWPEDDRVEVENNALLNHIAKEVHSFSLRALPWADDNGQESDEKIHNSSEKVYDWLIKNNLQADPSIERPPCEKRLWYDDYFQQNPYFAHSSEASSSNEPDPDGSRQNELEELRKADETEPQGQKTEANANPDFHSSMSSIEEVVYDDGEQAEELEISTETRQVGLSEERSDPRQESSKDSTTTSPQDLEFSITAYFVDHNSNKQCAIVCLDTAADSNFMSYNIAYKLGIPLQPILPMGLVTTTSDAADQTSLTTQYEVEVDWHFAHSSTMYTTKFLVLDMAGYDVLLGREAIIRYKLLQPGPAVLQTRHLGEEVGQQVSPVKLDKARSLGARMKSWFERRPG
ncbi:hypothetical protein AbraIFM66950_006298 [Aspergillus brasiliensis]|nr:hypothetical protein AbraIFM66950_006298 [Aspergillus brasiliensis]